MSSKKQTSVKWLVWELNKLGFFPNGVPQEIYKQAKEMEKQQIIEAYDSKVIETLANEYYKENYEI